MTTLPPPVVPVAWRGINELGEVVTDWIDGAPPAAFVDLCGNPSGYDWIELAYSPTAIAALTAELRGLSEKWRDMARRHRECGPNGAMCAEIREHDADELDATLTHLTTWEHSNGR